MATPRVKNRYPRRGERIAPATLADFLADPVPPRYWASRDDERLRLCDLDETAWQRFPADAIAELALRIVERVARFHGRTAFQQRRFPRPPDGLRLDDLRLENRTRRCLARAGLDDDLGPLGDYPMGEILGIRAFGPRCLVDLLCALESPGVDDRTRPREESLPVLCEELTAAAEALAALPRPIQASRDDPRLCRWLQTCDVKAGSVGELVRRLLDRTHDPRDPLYVVEQVRRLIGRIEKMPDLTIEEELIQVFAETPCQRNREILIGYYGWEDGQQHTLTEIGSRFGITRERIRQVCAKLTKKHQDKSKIIAPAMDRALATIKKRLPAAASELEADLIERGWTKIATSLEVVATGAKLLGRPVRVKVVRLEKARAGKPAREAPRLAVHPGQDAAALAAIDLAKKETYFHGLSTVDKITRTVLKKFPGRAERKLVAEALRLTDGFSWLHQPSGWFRLKPIAKHGLPKAIEKILSVVGEVTVSQMRNAMSRNHRLWKEPVPENVLLEYCRQTPDVRVEGKRIIAERPRDWKKELTGVELELVRVLKEHGPVMERGVMEDLCVEAGMNRFSFHAFVSWSPVLEQFGHSLYGLLGAEVPRKLLDELSSRRRAKRATYRVLDNHGRTEDGRVWLGYRLSKAASTYAVITIPAALKNEIRGRFEIRDADGQTIGTLATKDGRAWGLGALMRRRNAQIGDYVVLTLDLKSHTAEISLGAGPEDLA